MIARHKTKEELIADKEANNFAMNLLMPEEMFIFIFNGHRGEISCVADFFEVSECAAKCRAFELGLISYL